MAGIYLHYSILAFINNDAINFPAQGQTNRLYWKIEYILLLPPRNTP